MLFQRGTEFLEKLSEQFTGVGVPSGIEANHERLLFLRKLAKGFETEVQHGSLARAPVAVEGGDHSALLWAPGECSCEDFCETFTAKPVVGRAFYWIMPDDHT